MIIPSVEQIPGVQSANETCTGIGSNGPGEGRGTAWEEEMVASRKAHQPRANWETGSVLRWRLRWRDGGAYESAGEVDEELALAGTKGELREADEADAPGVVGS